MCRERRKQLKLLEQCKGASTERNLSRKYKKGDKIDMGEKREVFRERQKQLKLLEQCEGAREISQGRTNKMVK